MSYLYVETAFHHEGDFEYLKKLVLAAKQAEAKGVKFQVLTKVNDFLSSRHSGYDSLKNYCFTIDQWREIFNFTTELGLDIILMPLNEEALYLSKEFSIKFLEVHSVSFYDNPVLEAIKNTGVPVILGVGGRTLDEIVEKSIFFNEQLRVLMVGFQSFPSKLKDIKLGKIAKLKEFFPSLEIGYADHSAFDDPFAISSNEYARLLGATIFEKHIAIEEGVERVDFSSAVSVEKIYEIMSNLRFIDENILLSTARLFSLDKLEVNYRNRQKQVVANVNIPVGATITVEMLTTKMIDKPSGFTNYYNIVGKIAAVNILQDEIITENFLK